MPDIVENYIITWPSHLGDLKESPLFGESSHVTFIPMVKYSSLAILYIVKDKNILETCMCILFCRLTQTQWHCHDALCGHLIFLLHPTALH